MSNLKVKTLFNPFPEDVRKRLVGAFESLGFEELPPEPAEGCGVYALYYNGDFPAYQALKSRTNPRPIYVGKAVPPGGRKGGGRQVTVEGFHVTRRLREHSNSIRAVSNLEVEDFECRWLPVVESFVGTAEVILIDEYQPLWNVVITGFGIHAPGSGRGRQARSDWDMLHPGRGFATGLPAGVSVSELQARIRKHLG